MRPRLLDLITDHGTGRLSHSKLWANVGLGASVIVFTRMGWNGQISSEIFGLFLAGVCANAGVSKLLSLRYAQRPPAAGTEPVKEA